MLKNKHLSQSERIKIEGFLNNSYSFKSIANELNRDCTTISKEVKKHIAIKKSGAFGRPFNSCKFRYTCNHSYLCENPACKKGYCRNCSMCSTVCKDFVEEICLKLSAAPYVCNGCDLNRKCTLKKSFYYAKYAQKEYEFTLSESRSGINLDENEITRLDDFITPLIQKGHSIHHICANNIDTIMHSEKSIYNYIDSNILTAKNIDLPRKVRYRPRKKTKSHFKIDKKCRIGRTYIDFIEYIKNNPDIPIVQMDTVEGVKGGKVLLTIHFLESLFMIAFLRDANTSQSVIDIFEKLYLELNPHIFMNIFPLILTDNGSEFSNPSALEFDLQENRRTRIFYCDPNSPHQKGAVEVNHEFIRRIIPKGKSLDNYTQGHIDLMMSHINSYGRKKLNNQSPHQLFSLFHGESTLRKLNAILIPSNEILLKPHLLKK